MNIETLNRFCGSCGKMEFPWSVGEFTYATNGFVLVRSPRLDEVPEREGYDVSKFFAEPAPEGGWIDFPSIEEIGELVVCPKCHGKESPDDCPECDGDGDIEFSTNFNDYEVECKSCGGSGDGDCQECKGAGRIEPRRIVEFGGFNWSARDLRLFIGLSGLQVVLPLDVKGLGWVRFDGGIARMMPKAGLEEAR